LKYQSKNGEFLTAGRLDSLPVFLLTKTVAENLLSLKSHFPWS